MAGVGNCNVVNVVIVVLVGFYLRFEIWCGNNGDGGIAMW